MRAHRVITAIIAFALIGLTPFVGGTASATPADSASAARVSSSPSARAVTSVGAKIIKKQGKLFMVGYVKPAGRGTVIISKATECRPRGCNFRKFKEVNRNENGYYRARVYAPARGNWYWQARVGTVKSAIWKTFRV